MAKILLVEDDKLLRTMYQTQLGQRGYDVVTAETGKAVLALLLSYRPDLILLDIMLPGGMHGFDILQQIRIREEFKKTPVIMMTTLESEKATAMSSGAQDFIVKNKVTIEEVVAVIEKYLKKEIPPSSSPPATS